MLFGARAVLLQRCMVPALFCNSVVWQQCCGVPALYGACAVLFQCFMAPALCCIVMASVLYSVGAVLCWHCTSPVLCDDSAVRDCASVLYSTGVAWRLLRTTLWQSMVAVLCVSTNAFTSRCPFVVRTFEIRT